MPLARVRNEAKAAHDGESDDLPAPCLGAPFDCFLGERGREIEQRNDLRVVESRESCILEINRPRLLLRNVAAIRKGHG